jgi:hypothetical protein
MKNWPVIMVFISIMFSWACNKDEHRIEQKKAGERDRLEAINRELENQRQKTKESEKKLEEAKENLRKTIKTEEENVRKFIEKATIDFIESDKELKNDIIKIVIAYFDLTDEYFDKTKGIFAKLSDQQSKSGILESYFSDHKRPSVSALEKLDKKEIDNLQTDLGKIVSLAWET